jgi:hypothetical protein
VTLDVDVKVDVVHGNQQLSLFNPSLRYRHDASRRHPEPGRLIEFQSAE